MSTTDLTIPPSRVAGAPVIPFGAEDRFQELVDTDASRRAAPRPHPAGRRPD
jgi:hypothetical protein